MLLKHLEFVGFKSFAQKTTFDFPGGITGIVGPNGSGKSNVIDGVRWILGEREAKNLRGARAEDLIFAGTPKRARMGMAQVTITFDNSSGFFPVDFQEVVISRRIDRDGNSEYFLNKAEVRLKDIVDFFAKARLGTRGLAIVNQGNSDLFVKASPEDRRAMIEEILGLRQYQIKKHESERKLKSTRINLDKVQAMINEIAPHLRFLKRQTSKWEKVGEVETILKDLENTYFTSKLRDIRTNIKKFEPEIHGFDQQIKNKSEELKKLETELRAIESAKPAGGKGGELRARRNQLLQERSNIEREVSKLEAKIDLLHSMAASQKVDLRAGELLTALEDVSGAIKKLLKEKDLVAVHRDLETLLTRVERFTNGSARSDGEINDLKQAKDVLIKKIQPIGEELNRLAAQEENSAHEFERFNDEFRQAFEKVEKKKDEITELENAKQKVMFEIERLNYRKQDLELQTSQIERRLDEFEALIDTIAPVADLADIERKMMRVRTELAAIGDVDQALIKEAQETETRHQFLSQQLADLEKAATDLEQLIKELDLKIHNDFTHSLKAINEAFNKFFELMFGGGRAKLKLQEFKPVPAITEETTVDGVRRAPAVDEEVAENVEENPIEAGIDVEVSLPRKKINSLEMLSGGEKSLVSIAALFALISVSPPPFLVLDEVDAALDERNTKRFADLIREFSQQTQFILVTHNRATMEAANILYGITMEEDGVSKVLSVKLE